MNDLAILLNRLLKDSAEAKEFFKLKEFLQNDEYTTSFLNQITQVQKEVQEALKNNDTQTYLIKRKTMEVMKDEFLSNPIICNYIEARADLEDLLEQVVKILSD